MSKNFSVGDVVVCVDDAPRYRKAYLRRGRLYTVVQAEIDGFGDPLVCVAECSPEPWQYSDRFRLAYRPDPEVEREALKDPLTVQDEPKRRANAPKASERTK